MPRLKTGLLICAAMIAATPLFAETVSNDSAVTAEISSRAVAENLADMLVRDFVYPETGNAYAAMLRANAAAGQYDALSGAALAERLTNDLRTIYVDGHLRVSFGSPARGPGPVPAGGPQPGGPGSGAGPQGGPVRMAPPPAMEAERWLAPGIAFVRFNLFPDDAAVTEQAAKFMKDHAKAKVIIFDIRTHRGGGLEQMDVIFPWLFTKPTRLVSMATRKSVAESGGSPIDGIASLRRVDADPAFVTQEHWVTPRKGSTLTKAKVYLLTSSVTGSAAEHFSLAMKASKRGTLVGVATGGANHFGGINDLGGGFNVFMPVGRTYDPVTGKDWETTGVAPDIEVAPEQALITVLTREGIAAEEAAKLSAEVAPKLPMVRQRPSAVAPQPKPAN